MHRFCVLTCIIFYWLILLWIKAAEYSIGHNNVLFISADQSSNGGETGTSELCCHLSSTESEKFGHTPPPPPGGSRGSTSILEGVSWGFDFEAHNQRVCMFIAASVEKIYRAESSSVWVKQHSTRADERRECWTSRANKKKTARIVLSIVHCRLCDNGLCKTGCCDITHTVCWDSLGRMHGSHVSLDPTTPPP